MRLLEEFWYGNIEPTEYDTNSCKEYKEVLRLITRNEEKLQATIWVGIGFLFSFIVPLSITNFGGSQVYVSCTGTVNPVVSRHRAPFTFVRPAGRGALPAEV